MTLKVIGWDFTKKEDDVVDNMKTVTIKVAQNGGEYYGYCKVESMNGDVEKIDHKTVYVDGMKISFDEHIEVVSVK